MTMYGDNFGYRRSDESMAIAEGRFKTPASGNALKLGTAVEIDPANPGRMKASATATTPIPGFHGLLVQEEAQISDYYFKDWRDSHEMGLAKKDTLSVIRCGAGTKVWFRNTAQSTTGDGTVIPAVTMFTQGTIAVGEKLSWNGTVWVESASNPWMVVTHVETDYLEAVLLF